MPNVRGYHRKNRYGSSPSSVRIKNGQICNGTCKSIRRGPATYCPAHGSYQRPAGKYTVQVSHRKAGKATQEVEVKDSGGKADFTLEAK